MDGEKTTWTLCRKDPADERTVGLSTTQTQMESRVPFGPTSSRHASQTCPGSSTTTAYPTRLETSEGLAFLSCALEPLANKTVEMKTDRHLRNRSILFSSYFI
jgi:hypothetical protein